MDRTLVDRLRRRIAAALVLAPACTDRGLGDDSGGEGMGEATSQTASASASQGEATRGDDSPGEDTRGGDDIPGEDTRADDTRGDATSGDDDSGVHFDLGMTPDAGLVGIPMVDCTAPPVTTTEVCTTVSHEDNADYEHLVACIEATVDGTCPPADDESVQLALSCACNAAEMQPTCGPDQSIRGVCCYWTIIQPCLNPGRPFVVHGRDRLAGLTTRGDWADAIAIDTSGLAPELRAALARAWAEDARCEHAAVASFARFTLQLVAVGAPAELVARAQRAGLDELAHARAFFGLATVYGGEPLGPDALDTTDALADGHALEHVVVATVREGCIAETISLVQLATALAHVRDPALVAVLATIVEQELEHVELAWSFVAWALECGDERLLAAVTSAFDAAETAIPRVVARDPAAADLPGWAAHGRLSAQDSTALAHATLREVVRPSARRLLADRPRARPRASVVSADPAMR